MIVVVSIPPLATVQDLGRDGQWHQGLGRAGAMDALAHRVANLLLDNDEAAATLEIPLTPARFRFDGDTAFSLAGAPCGATLDGRALPRVWAGPARKGQVLELGGMPTGARVYLGLPGGIDVPVILGSRSTQLREAFGGHEGRVLEAGDRLTALRADTPSLPEGGLSLEMPPIRRDGQTAITLRTLVSTEYDDFSEEARAAFWSTPFTVTPQSNRQGYRLEGATLKRQSAGELRSHGIVPGIVQVPGGGAPIIQLADSATMGGYPKIAAVIAADLWRLGQARAGDTLCFERIDPAAAADVDAALDRTLADWRTALSDVFRQHESWT